MEATIFAVWVYNHLFPHTAQVKVGDAACHCGSQDEERSLSMPGEIVQLPAHRKVGIKFLF